MKTILLSAMLVGFLVLPIMVGQAERKDCDTFSESICRNHAKNGCIWDQTQTSARCIGLFFPEGTAGDILINFIGTIGNWVFAGVLAVASLFLIYAGFLWVTAGGDPQAATKARQMLTNALIGVVVALLARGIVQVIKSVVGSSD